MNDAERVPAAHDQLDEAAAEITLPEALLLLLFNPRGGNIVGEGLNLLYALGGAMLTELAVRGHLELDDRKRAAHRVGTGPEDPFLRRAWERILETPTEIRTLVVDIGTRSRESTLDRLVDRGDIASVPHRLLGFIPTHALEDGGTGTREALLAPVRAALVDDEEPDARTAALAALLSASKNLPAMDADIPWAGHVYTRGKEFERGTGGAKATSDVLLIALTVQIAGAGLAGFLGNLARPE